MKSFLVIIGVILLSSLCSASKYDGLEKFQKFGEDFKDMDTSDPIKTVRSILAFGNLVPELAPFTDILSGILGMFEEDKTSEELEEIKKEQDQLESHLEMIDRNLLKIAYGIDDLMIELVKRTNKIFTNQEDVLIKKSYKDHVENINMLMHSYERYIRDIKDKTLKADFTGDCDKYSPIHFADYISDELKNQRNLPLNDLITRDNDIYSLAEWSKIMATDLTKSMFMMGMCMAAKGTTKSSASIRLFSQWTFFDAKEQYSKTFHDAFNDLHVYVENAQTMIHKNFMNTAKVFVQDFAEENRGLSHEDMVAKIQAELVKKYPFRYFAVWAWDDKSDAELIIGGGNQTNAIWWHIANRGLYVTSTNYDGYDIQPKLQQCVDDHKSSWSNTNQAYASISDCFPYEANAIAVMQGRQVGWSNRRNFDVFAMVRSDPWAILVTGKDSYADFYDSQHTMENFTIFKYNYALKFRRSIFQ